MKREEELVKQLTEMYKDTKFGKIKWEVKCQTTEYNDPSTKPVMEEEDILWTIDECYVSYYCEYKGKEFLMITYEMLHSAGDKVKSTNMVFLPPLGIRYFDIHTLLPYSIETTNMVAYQIQALWNLLLDMYKANRESVNLDVSERVLTIED